MEGIYIDQPYNIFHYGVKLQQQLVGSAAAGPDDCKLLGPGIDTFIPWTKLSNAYSVSKKWEEFYKKNAKQAKNSS
jgi:hypothetical protein